jgi:hypothetical protein
MPRQSVDRDGRPISQCCWSDRRRFVLYHLAGHQPVEQMPQRGQAQLDGRGRMRARLLLDPSGDVQRLHGGDRPHPVSVAPGHALRRGVGLGPSRVRVADVGCREFQEAERGAIAGGGDQRRHGVGGDADRHETGQVRPQRRRTGTSPKMFFGSELSKVRNEHQTQGTAEATQDKESRHRYGNLSDSRPSA